MTRPSHRGPALGRLVLIYVALLPLGHLVLLPVQGATATLTDVVLLALLAAGALALLGSALSPEASPFRPLDGDVKIGLGLLAAFGAWTALSAIWGYHGEYAVAKGFGLVALSAGALLIASSGVSLRRLLDAWIIGAVAALLVTVAVALVGSHGMKARLLYDGGLIGGLPFVRLNGPFIHPNMMGEYLVVTGALFWARSPGLKRESHRLWVALTTLFVVSLVLTASTAWVAAGVALVVLAGSRRFGGSAPVRALVGAGGLALAAATLVGVATQLSVDVAGLRITTGGIRPEIWSDALAAVRESPLLGVGAAPYLAETVDPLAPSGGTALWDAHSTYLSVLGQFGVVGGLLFFGGLAWVARGVRRAEPASELQARLRFALFALLLGLLVHWITLAGEDARHLWALVGVAAWLGERPE